jgi:hypothetical protein
MRQQTAGCLHYKKLGGLGPALLVTALSLTLIWMGCLIWMNNSLALIPDNDPRTNINIEMMVGFDSGKADHQWHQAGHSPDSSGGVLCARGNGNRDDNRERSFVFQPPLGEEIVLAPINVETGFDQRRTVAAYKDFGHLKVMPADDAGTIEMGIY